MTKFTRSKPTVLVRLFWFHVNLSAECPKWLNWEHFYELKRRWKVSVGALVHRAYNLECISESTYERACMHLSRTSERLQERYEPAPEKPYLLELSLNALQQDQLSRREVAKFLGWSHDTRDIELLLRPLCTPGECDLEQTSKGLAGSPDIVFTRLKIAIFVDGDFWHGHDFATWWHKLSDFGAPK